jgi:hypothetical protein
MKYAVIIALIILVLLSGCVRKTYICYDGQQKEAANKCPVAPRITEISAGQAVDNYGRAIAQAKQVSYTKVNIYYQNGAFYSNVLFSNAQTQTVKQVQLKVNGTTSDVTCVSGCDFLD